MRHLLLILLSSCAANQSAFPPFNPVMDAPITTGQPGTFSPAAEYPRSADGRALPQTVDTMKGPGIWAGSGDMLDPTLFGVPVPAPSTSNPRADSDLANACVDTLTASASKLGPLKRFARFPTPHLECIVANLYVRCAKVAFEEEDAKKRSGVSFDMLSYKRHADLYNKATDFLRAKCRRGLLIEEEEAAWIDVATVWEALWRAVHN